MPAQAERLASTSGTRRVSNTSMSVRQAATELSLAVICHKLIENPTAHSDAGHIRCPSFSDSLALCLYLPPSLPLSLSISHLRPSSLPRATVHSPEPPGHHTEGREGALPGPGGVPLPLGDDAHAVSSVSHERRPGAPGPVVPATPSPPRPSAPHPRHHHPRRRQRRLPKARRSLVPPGLIVRPTGLGLASRRRHLDVHRAGAGAGAGCPISCPSPSSSSAPGPSHRPVVQAVSVHVMRELGRDLYQL